MAAASLEPRQRRRLLARGLVLSLLVGQLSPAALGTFCRWPLPLLRHVSCSRSGLRAQGRQSYDEERGFSRRPLRPARYGEGPNSRFKDGRGEWQSDQKFSVNWGDYRLANQFQEDDRRGLDDSGYAEDGRRSRRRDRRNRDDSPRTEWDRAGASLVSDVRETEETIRRSVPRFSGGRRSRRGLLRPPRQWVPTEERQESWRPPLFRPASEVPPQEGSDSSPERGSGRQASTPPSPRADASWLDSAPWRAKEEEDAPVRRPSGEEHGERPAKPSRPQLQPPARPVNLEALAAQGLPKVNLYQLEPEEFDYYIIRELGLPAMRSQQIRKWVMDKGAQDFMKMANIPIALREQLSKLASIGADDWQVLAEKESVDGTVKLAYGVPGGHAIESVLMPYDDGRRTACVSSQVGCAMGCVFCATGQMGFKRHLTADEIYEQAARFSARLRRQGLRLSSVVLLGMGEPLANFNNTVKAIRRINRELGIGMRHITISTVGLVPEIERLAQEKLPVTLAISLHAATDEERSELLPMNRRYPIKSVMEAASQYFQATGRRVSFEWTLIAGENDTPKSARELGKLIKTRAPGSHVNLIPLNPTNGYQGGPSQREATAKFVAELKNFNVEATVRVRRGIDIDAGCGQLAERAAAEYNERAAAAAGALADTAPEREEEEKELEFETVADVSLQ